MFRDGEPVFGTCELTKQLAIMAWWAIEHGDGNMPCRPMGNDPSWLSARNMGWSVKPITMEWED